MVDLSILIYLMERVPHRCGLSLTCYVTPDPTEMRSNIPVTNVKI